MLDVLTRRLKAIPLRLRLVLIVVSLLAVGLLLTTLATTYLIKRDLMDRVDSELASVSAPLTNQVLRDLRSESGTTTPTGYAIVLMPTEGESGIVINPTGETRTPALPLLGLGDPRVTEHLPFTVGSTDGPLQWRFVAGSLRDGSATFAVGVPLRSVDRTVARLLVTAGVLSAAVLALCLLLAWYAVKRAFRPLSEIETTAAAIASGDLTRRIPVRPADDEVTSLSRSLNAMLREIEHSFERTEASEGRMRQFVADASHELRTPLATVRGYAELYRQGAVVGPEQVSAVMDRIEGESTRMSGLVEDLLMLARLDEERATEFVPVDLTVLAADALTDARVRDPDRPIRLVSVGGPLEPTEVRGDEDRLRQVVTNLVANALRHTPAGTPVEIAVGERGGSAALEVRDHGPGISAEDSARVFERFYRSDPSRGRATGGGNGLGLAIVAAIVASHHGRVGVAETDGGGSTFVVELPTATSQAAPSTL